MAAAHSKHTRFQVSGCQINFRSYFLIRWSLQLWYYFRLDCLQKVDRLNYRYGKSTGCNVEFLAKPPTPQLHLMSVNYLFYRHLSSTCHVQKTVWGIKILTVQLITRISLISAGKFHWLPAGVPLFLFSVYTMRLIQYKKYLQASGYLGSCSSSTILWLSSWVNHISP